MFTIIKERKSASSSAIAPIKHTQRALLNTLSDSRGHSLSLISPLVSNFPALRNPVGLTSYQSVVTTAIEGTAVPTAGYYRNAGDKAKHKTHPSITLQLGVQVPSLRHGKSVPSFRCDNWQEKKMKSRCCWCSVLHPVLYFGTQLTD